MRKMKKHRIAGFVFSMFLYLIDFTAAEDNFENADTISDLMSAGTGQHFDLRHTIPGVPEVDYPIYSEVPKTSFECTGRHEGYYADIESRCQAFHICTHTTRAVSGFGFLCPNGTLFSQKHFVCDWYRNVDCNESEKYYSKNDANRIGSSLDMLETVRQIMEYPMKTISKALQQNTGSSRKPAQRQQNRNRAQKQQNNGDDSDDVNEQFERNSKRGNTARKSVTRAQVESVHSRGTKKFNQEETIIKNESYNSVTQEQNNSKNIKSVTKQQSKKANENSSEEDVFVNSLGELSTDPGVHFDRTNAHIIAEPRNYRYEKNNNIFAQKVNAALNDLADLSADNEKIAPDYVKKMRVASKSESAPIDLAANINGLLDEIANDLNPNTSGYQVQAPTKSKHSFRFLSRGFSSQNDPYKYQKPKQTESTLRFTPNQLPLDDEKEIKKPTLEIADDAAGFGQSSTTTTTTTTPQADADALDYLKPPIESPAFEETPDLKLEESAYLQPPLLPAMRGDRNSTETEKIITTTAANGVYTVTPSAADLPIYADLADTTTTTTEATDVAQNLVVSQQQQISNHKNNDDDEELQLDDDRLDAHKKAENLFLSGLQLTANENDNETSTTHTPLLIQVPDDHSYLTAWVTSSTVTPVSSATEALTTTTTETSAIDAGSLQARIRNYRRLTSLRGATPKSVIYGKHGHLRMETKSTTKTSTTPKTTRTTQSYLKRVAASRLRLSRLAAMAGNKNNSSLINATNQAASILPHDNAIVGDDKKFSVRNIDKETAIAGNSLSGSDTSKSQGIVTLESVRNSLQRFQINHNNKQSIDGNNEQPFFSNSPSPAIVEEISTTARSTLIRSRNRFANFKMPANLLNRETTTTTNSTSSTSASNFNSHTNLPLSFINSQLSNNNQAQNQFINSIADKTNLNSNSAQSSVSSPNLSSNNFIAFDKLTRSIVDDSILQNYRAAPILGRSSFNSAAATNAFQARSSTSSSSASALNAYQTNSRNAFNNQIFAKSNQLQAPAISQLTPPQRPASHFSHFNAAPTTPGPRAVIARAEGQQIEPNSVSSIISSLITQQQPKSLTKQPYVPLDDYLTRQFVNQSPTKATQIASTYQQQTQYQHNQQQSYQQTYQARPSIVQQYQTNQYRQQPSYQQKTSSTTALASPQPTLPTIYTQQNQQSNQKHLQFNQQLSAAQPLATHNIFATYQKQQQQLPQFPPLGTQSPIQSGLTQQSPTSLSSSSTQSFQKLSTQFNDGSNFLNIKLPSLTNGLIPAPTVQTAQKRSDTELDNLEYTASSPLRSVFSGATSYDVPLNSIGRLPNDITALFRRLRRY